MILGLRQTLIMLIVALFIAISSLATFASAYRVEDLGQVGPSCINNKGQIVGTFGVKNTIGNKHIYHAFLWQKGVLRDLGTPAGYPNASAHSINDHGQVVGEAYVAETDDIDHGHAVLWQAGHVIDLNAGTHYPFSTAQCINEQGQIVGYAGTGASDQLNEIDYHAFLWDKGKAHEMGSLGGRYSYAYGINSHSQIVGKADLGGARPDGGLTVGYGQTHAFLRQQGRMLDLHKSGGNSLAYAVNRQGQAVGFAVIGEPVHAFLWEAGQATDLGALSGPTGISLAMSINDTSQIVGYSHNAESSIYHAFLWQDKIMVDLNSLIPPASGWILEYAFSINNRGQVVGTGQHNGRLRAFLLTPILGDTKP